MFLGCLVLWNLFYVQWSEFFWVELRFPFFKLILYARKQMLCVIFRFLLLQVFHQTCYPLHVFFLVYFTKLCLHEALFIWNSFNLYARLFKSFHNDWITVGPSLIWKHIECDPGNLRCLITQVNTEIIVLAFNFPYFYTYIWNKAFFRVLSQVLSIFGFVSLIGF